MSVRSLTKKEVNPIILIAILSVIGLVAVGFIGKFFLTPAPVIPNPATVNEPGPAKG